MIHNSASDQKHRAEACLLGLACGDAVGATVENCLRGYFTPLDDMIGGGQHCLKKGQWTDDTAMTLCLGESLIHCSGFNALDQMNRYLRWATEGYNSSRSYPIGLGKTVRDALSKFRDTGEPYSGSVDSRNSGNGSLMRLAPIPIYYANNEDDAVQYAELNSRTTHASPECIASCQYLTILIITALPGLHDKTSLLTRNPNFKIPDALLPIVNNEFKNKSIDQIKGSGYVVESLEAALWSFWNTDNFRDAILTAANLGDDADTTAAICGQLAGAYYGMEDIPLDWIESLHRSVDIRNLACQLSAMGDRHYQN